jgi:AraC family transcriptional regulator, ethanolamine operon transcriptional activator
MMFIGQTYDDASQQWGNTVGWRQHYRQLGAGRYRSAFDLMTLPGVTVSRERINVSVMQETGSPASSTVFLFPLAADGGWRINSHHEQDSVVALRQGDTELLTAVGADSDLIAVAFDTDLLPPPARRAGTFSFPRLPADALLIDWIGSLLALSKTGFTLDEQDARLLSELLAERFMDLGVRVDGGLSVDRLDAPRLDTFRTVQKLIDRLPDEPVTLSGLSRRMEMPMGNIYTAIGACTGLSPTNWLKSYRLDGARRDLLSARRSGRKIADIAMSWGFMHLGRFSCGYHRHFGETPRATRNRVTKHA